jgi:hypothetical protein
VERMIEVPRDGEVNIRLEPLPPGTLVIMVQPWADIFVDGVRRTRQGSRCEITLPQGIYVVELRNESWRDSTFNAEVVSGENRQYEVHLRKQRSGP